jgi:hypothetical protein
MTRAEALKKLQAEMDAKFTFVCTPKEAKERLRWMNARHAELMAEVTPEPMPRISDLKAAKEFKARR